MKRQVTDCFVWRRADSSFFVCFDDVYFLIVERVRSGIDANSDKMFLALFFFVKTIYSMCCMADSSFLWL